MEQDVMDEEWSRMASSSIAHAADMAKLAIESAARQYERPSLLYKPTVTRDGDMWCALFGENLQEGVAGFGPTPDYAMAAFDTAWLTESGSHIIERKVPA